MSRVSFCLVLGLSFVLLPGGLLASRSTEHAEDQVKATGSSMEPESERLAEAQGPSGSVEDFLLLPEPYYYEGFGRRDLFVSLVSGNEEAPDPNARPAICRSSGYYGPKTIDSRWSKRRTAEVCCYGKGQCLETEPSSKFSRIRSSFM